MSRIPCVECGQPIPTPTSDPFRCPSCRHPQAVARPGPSAAELEKLASSIARRIKGSSSGEALIDNITTALLAFPNVPPLIRMLAGPPLADPQVAPPHQRRPLGRR